MNTSDKIAVISAIVAGLGFLAAGFSIIYAHLAWTSARQAILHEALSNIHADYRSAEMLEAIKTLWDFHRLHGADRFVDEYEKTRAADDATLSTIPTGQRIEFIKSTLHHKRRLVSHFYQHLAALYANKILTADVLYSGWGRNDLRIIPEILAPLELSLAEALGSRSPKLLMTQLYDDAPGRP